MQRKTRWRLAGLAARLGLPDVVCRLADAASGAASGRRTSACRLPDTVWQTVLCQMTSGRRHLTDAVCQTRSARCCLPDSVCCLADGRLTDGGVCQTALWQTWRLADAVFSRLFPINFSPILTLYQPMTHICVMSSHKPIRIYMGGSILGVNTLYRLFCFFKLFSLVGKGLKHTGVKPSLVPTLYPRTQTNCNVKRDGVWQPDAVCQTPHLACRLADAVYGRRPLGRRSLADGIWQTASGRRPSGRRHLADAVCHTRSARCRLPDSVCRPADTASARSHLPDGIWQMADGVCQTALCQTAASARWPSGRRGLFPTFPPF